MPKRTALPKMAWRTASDTHLISFPLPFLTTTTTIIINKIPHLIIIHKPIPHPHPRDQTQVNLPHNPPLRRAVEPPRPIRHDSRSIVQIRNSPRRSRPGFLLSLLLRSHSRLPVRIRKTRQSKRFPPSEILRSRSGCAVTVSRRVDTMSMNMFCPSSIRVHYLHTFAGLRFPPPRKNDVKRQLTVGKWVKKRGCWTYW